MRLCRACVLVLLFSAATSQANEACPQERELSFGAMPWTNAQVAELWSGRIAEHFESHCMRLRVSSAASVAAYVRLAVDGEYHLVDTAPHVASYLILQHGFHVVAREDYGAQAVIFARTTAGIAGIEDFRARRFALPAPLAIVSLMARALLNEYGEVRFLNYTNHDNVVRAVLRGDADGGVVLQPIINAHQGFAVEQLHTVAVLPQSLNGLVLAAPGVDALTRARAGEALIAFEPPPSPLWQRWHPADEAWLHRLHAFCRPFVEQLEFALQEPEPGSAQPDG